MCINCIKCVRVCALVRPELVGTARQHPCWGRRLKILWLQPKYFSASRSVYVLWERSLLVRSTVDHPTGVDFCSTDRVGSFFVVPVGTCMCLAFFCLFVMMCSVLNAFGSKNNKHSKALIALLMPLTWTSMPFS